VTAVYAIVLIVGILSLIAWMVAHALAEGTRRDPELRFGTRGRASVGGMVGFGMAGMSAEFAAIDIGPALVGVLAVAGAVGGGWWAAVMGNDKA